MENQIEAETAAFDGTSANAEDNQHANAITVDAADSSRRQVEGTTAYLSH